MGTQDTCEVKEVKKAKEVIEAGYTPPCWRPRGGRPRGSPSPQAAASTSGVLMGWSSLFCEHILHILHILQVWFGNWFGKFGRFGLVAWVWLLGFAESA